MPRLVVILIMLMSLGAAYDTVRAAEIADPMRPAAAATPAAPAPRRADAAEPAAPPVWPVLQAVQVGAAPADSTALIDGRLVRVGDRLGAVTVAVIDATGVLLRGARFEQRLALLPGITKTASAVPATSPAAAVNLAVKDNR